MKTNDRHASPIVAASLLLCLVFSGAQATPDDEPIPPLKASLSVLAGPQLLLDRDMQDTYGMMPYASVRLSLQVSKTGEFFAGIGYAGDRGYPYTGSIGFEGGEKASIRFIPIEFGTRFNLAHSRYQRFYLGFALDLVRITEEIPGTNLSAADESPKYSGWGPNLRFLVSPEWHIKSERLAFGFEFSLGGHEVRIGHEEDRRTVEMAAYSLRAYLRRHL